MIRKLVIQALVGLALAVAFAIGAGIPLSAHAATVKPTVIDPTSGQQRQVKSSDSFLLPFLSASALAGSDGSSDLVTVNLSGDVTTSGGVATTIASHAVSYAKMQQASASSLLGNPTGSTANVQEITLGAGLSFSGSTLIVSASGLYCSLTGCTYTGLVTFNAGARITPEATPTCTEVGYQNLPIDEEDANYTFALTDLGEAVRSNAGSAIAYTIPPNSSVAFPVCSLLVVRVYGAGTVTLTQGAGVSLRQAGQTSTGNIAVLQGGLATLWQETANNWVLTSISYGASSGGAGVGGSSAGAAIPQGRLTLTSGTPVMTADVSAGATIYYDCYNGKGVPYYNGSSDATDPITSCELSTALKASSTGVENSGDVFDVFYAHSAATICVVTNGSGGGWSSDSGGGSTTLRGTGYSQVHNTRGYWTNQNSLNHCYNGATDEGAISADQATYLGSFYATAAGTTAMQFAPAAVNGGTNNFLGLFNAYNRVAVDSVEQDGNAGTRNWTYNSGTCQAADNSASNRITFIDGLGQLFIEADYHIVSTSSTSLASTGINEDSTSAVPRFMGQGSVSGGASIISIGSFAPKIGLHYIQAMDCTSGNATQTYYGSAANHVQSQYYALRVAASD